MSGWSIEWPQIYSGLGPAILTAVLGLIGYLVHRYRSRAKSREQATYYSDLASLAGSMKEHGLSISDIEAVDALIRTKKRQSRTAEVAEELREPDRYWTQAAMNMRAGAAARTADAQLDEALVSLSGFLSEDEEEALRATQEAWTTFRDRQADFAASEFEGGTMQPLIRAAERESLTRGRLAAILATIEERKAR